MSDDKPNHSTRLTEVLKAIDQPNFIDKLKAMNPTNPSALIGAATLMQLHESGMLTEFASWATHPLSGVMYRNPEVYPVPENLSNAVAPVVTATNIELAKKDSEKPKPENPVQMFRREANKRILGFAATYTLIWAGSEASEYANHEKDKDKKFKAGAKGFAIGAAIAAAPALAVSYLMENVGIFAGGGREILKATPEKEPPHILSDDALKYACQTLEKFVELEQAKAIK